jgi:cytochrome b involved in lipid metabolism
MGTMPCPATYTGRWAPEDKDLYTPADLLSHAALTFLSKPAEARSSIVHGKKKMQASSMSNIHATEEDGGQQSEVTEQSIINTIISILRESKGTATVAATVVALYKTDTRNKDFVKNQLGITVVALLERHPTHFALDAAKHLVALSSDETSAHVFTMDEISRHNHKEDAWIVVNDEVYNITEFVRTHWGWNAAGSALFCLFKCITILL